MEGAAPSNAGRPADIAAEGQCLLESKPAIGGKASRKQRVPQQQDIDAAS
jgi:hypothetical protein